MFSPEDLADLEQLINTTWGRSSIITPTMSVKCEVVGPDRLRVIFTTLGTFASDRAMSQQMGSLENESIKVTDDYLTKLKSAYKDSTGKTLKFELVASQPSTEIVSLQPHISPRRTAYYRRTSILRVS